MRTRIKNGRVLPMTGKDASFTGDIIIEGQKILALGPSLPQEMLDSCQRTIDAGKHVVLPGLVNAHTHGAMVLLRSYADDLPLMRWLEEEIWPAEAKLTGEDVYWGSLLAIAEMLRSGTTAFADMYFFMEEVARGVQESGIRANLSRGMIGLGPNGETAKRDAEALFKSWNGQADGRISIWLGPHAPYTCQPEYLKDVMALADQLGTGIHIHLAETSFEVNKIKEEYGATPVALMDSLGLFSRPVLAAHCVHLTQEEIDILVKKRVAIAHNPESNMKLASGIAPIEELRKQGALVAIGTDGASSNNNLDMFEEMRTASFLQKVHSGEATALPAYETLYMATSQGSAALGFSDVGTLEPGKQADIILVNMDQVHLSPQHDPVANLVYAARGSDVDTVLVAGRVLMEKGKLLTLDEEKIKYECNQRAQRITVKS